MSFDVDEYGAIEGCLPCDPIHASVFIWLSVGSSSSHAPFTRLKFWGKLGLTWKYVHVNQGLNAQIKDLRRIKKNFGSISFTNVSNYYCKCLSS